MIYFDNSATTPIYPQALDTYVKTSQRIIGNPSSLHDLGSQANRLLQQARKQIAELIDVSANEIYFTSGGTEGDNWVLKGTAIEKREFGNHIIISAVEHPAVTETAEQLVELGFELSYAPVDKEGRVKVEELQKLIRKETILVSVMAKALRLHLENEQQRPQHVATLRSYLLKALEEFQNVTVFSQDNEHFAPHILCFALKGIRGEVLVHALEEKQIYISTTSACSSRKKMASSTLYAMHVPGELAISAVRISLDESNTMAEIEQFMIVFNQLYQKFSRVN